MTNLIKTKELVITSIQFFQKKQKITNLINPKITKENILADMKYRSRKTRNLMHQRELLVQEDQK